MTDERTELRGQVTAEIASGLWLDANPPKKLVPVLEDTAASIVRMVEADVARRLLGWDAVRAAVDVIDDRTGHHEQEYAQDTLQAALTAIGIEPREDGEG